MSGKAFEVGVDSAELLGGERYVGGWSGEWVPGDIGDLVGVDVGEVGSRVDGLVEVEDVDGGPVRAVGFEVPVDDDVE